MGRLVEIHPDDLDLAGEGQYLERVIKYIPSEVVAAYLALSGVLEGGMATNPESARAISWLVYIAGIVVTPLYLKSITRKRRGRRAQLIIACVAFAVWGYALGGPFRLSNLYVPYIASVLLLVYTFAVGWYEPPAVAD
jgi:hypothetical protein